MDKKEVGRTIPDPQNITEAIRRETIFSFIFLFSVNSWFWTVIKTKLDLLRDHKFVKILETLYIYYKNKCKY